MSRPWSIEQSLDLYNVPYWGGGFFDINAAGHLCVRPDGPGGQSIDLAALTTELRERGIDTPVLLRFPGVVRQRLERFATVFHNAFASRDYKGRYRGVYPIKVNQQRHLVEALVDNGKRHHFGLEAGSKPELLVSLALLDDPSALIVCNGYKDESFVEMAILARQLGRDTVIVIEKYAEVELAIRVARRLGVRPRLGMRVRLSRPGHGRWRASSGDLAKFGLTPVDALRMVEALREADMLDCLCMLHFHIGSQVSAIRTFKEALEEASRFFVELSRLGAPLSLFDVGGGLGVDYDGSRTDFDYSVNYSDQEYADDVVRSIQTACDDAGLKHPDIVTESGRATVAHQSVLVFDVLGVEGPPWEGPPGDVSPDDPQPTKDLRALYDTVNERTYQQAWHDALAWREQGLQGFNLGMFSLAERARLEELFWKVVGRIRQVSKNQSYVPDDLERLDRMLAEIYYCNFSVFQSVPDAWAIDQLFPVVPLQRLDEWPDRQAVLADLTCDSDGKIERFIDRRDVKKVLELHALRPGEPYFLAMPLVGAYQEILGDMHNLFGDTNAVHVSAHPDGDYSIDLVIEGDTVNDALGYVQYDRKSLMQRMRDACEAGIRSGKVTMEQTRRLVQAYQAAIDGYTYLQSTKHKAQK